MNEINFPSFIRSKAIIVKSDAEIFSRLFREGEVATGKVIGQIDARHVVLRFKGQNLLVETTIPLAEQEEKYFRIEATSPQVILKLLPEGVGRDSPADWLKKYLSHDVPSEDLAQKLSGFWKTDAETFPSGIRETVREFLKLLHTFSLEHLSQNPVALQEAMVRSGLFFENKLKQYVEGDLKATVASLLKGDLKGLLLKLSSQLNSFSGPKDIHSGEQSLIEGLGKGIDQFVKKIELFQLLNLVQSDPQEKIFLFLPLCFANHPQFLELNISLPREGSKGREDGTFSILFLLHLPQLGRMNIEVKIKGKSLYCLFKVTDPEVSKFMDPFLSDLKTRLDSLGCESHLQLSTEPLTQASSSLISEVGEDLNSLLSIVV